MCYIACINYKRDTMLYDLVALVTRMLVYFTIYDLCSFYDSIVCITQVHVIQSLANDSVSL